MINKTINKNLPDELSLQISLYLPLLNKTLTACSNDSILDILNQNNLLIYAPCGGKGVCGKCKVIVHGAVNPLTDSEKKILHEEEIKHGTRLACKTYIKSAAEVRLIDTSLENHTKELISSQRQYLIKSRITKKQVLPDEPTLENSFSIVECIQGKLNIKKIPFSLIKDVSELDIAKQITVTLYNDELISVEQDDSAMLKYGVAIDIGTTTLACYLMDLDTGKQLSVLSTQNPQAGYGADVVSRIHFCIEDKKGLEILTETIRNEINSLIQRTACKAQVKSENIYECVIVGNTTMNHLFLGINPKSLSVIPFNPVVKDSVFVNASSLGINTLNKNAKLTFLPNIGGFVGSDTVGCIIEANLIKKTDNCRVLIDLGTNGEIVLSSKNGIYACSTAAGPAFEGANISCGMQAFEGAINCVKIEDDIKITTINNKPAKGICGSALIDIVSEFLKSGIINISGKVLNGENIENENIKKRIISNGRNKSVIIAYANETEHDEDIVITQKDIREIQLAKSAIMSGINILLKTAEYTSNDINEILLAGAFGNFINKENALSISLFPKISLDKVKSLGNAAGGGAKIYLCDSAFSEEKTKEDFEKVKHIEISTHSDFQNEFVDNMLF